MDPVAIPFVVFLIIVSIAAAFIWVSSAEQPEPAGLTPAVPPGTASRPARASHLILK